MKTKPRQIIELEKQLGVKLEQKNLSQVRLFGSYQTFAVDDKGEVIALHLSNVRFAELPAPILQLTNLTVLRIHNVGLTSIPREIVAYLPNLKMLDLGENNIKVLPREIFTHFGEVSTLWTEQCNLSNNPIEVPPIEVIEQGRHAVLAYFDEVARGETQQLFEAKMLIVGQGNVGKTYLVNRLMHDKTPATVSTEGIDINRWVIPTKQTNDFRVNIWDFGGQEIYHATHQFFLTRRSLYLFVWEARTDSDLLSFDYWLNTIRVLSDNSPVIVIQNKLDERRKAINQESWQKRFPNIVDFHDVSAKDGSGCQDLKTMVLQNIEALPHIGDLLPKRWMDIRNELEALADNFIPYDRYREICAFYKMDEIQANRLSEYYHDLGVFLHFRHNPILRNTIFLKPDWATNAVYKVIDNPKVKENYGKFHLDDLGAIWKDEREYPIAKHGELVELMKSFELCFELPAGQGYIIPELIRANQPVFAWDYTENLRFKYVYDFMPAGIMTRFIVRTHDLINAELYWKDGVTLERENTEALIIKSDSRVIELWIRGADKTGLLGIIRREIDHMHSSFSNLQVREMVPCICSTCAGLLEPHFYSYDTLLEAQKKVSEIQCQISFRPVPIAQLLTGVGPKPPEPQSPRMPEARTIRIFLASSNELKYEREQVELLISKENRRLHPNNIFIDLVLWEDLKHSFHPDRFQDRINKYLLTCDVVICMFFKKVGAFTREEFDIAYQYFKAGQKPRHLYVFFKSGKVDINEIDEEVLKIRDLRKEIEGAEQIYKQFKSDTDLILQLKNQLELVISENE